MKLTYEGLATMYRIMNMKLISLAPKSIDVCYDTANSIIY